MNKKRIIILVVISVITVGLLTGYLFWANQRASFYANNADAAPDKQEKILNLEKSLTLWKKPENIISLSELYISIGRNDLAEKIMLGRGEVDVLNKLGSLYLIENKVVEAENTFTKAKNKKLNADSLKGLILTELKKGDRGVAENYLSKLSEFDINSANCYGGFVNLDDFKKAKDSYTKVKSCNLHDVDKHFATFNDAQNPVYLKLETVNLYYSQNYLNLAEKDILALLKEKDNFRDAHILASKIYEKLGNQSKSTEHAQKALQLDPVVQN